MLCFLRTLKKYIYTCFITGTGQFGAEDATGDGSAPGRMAGQGCTWRLPGCIARGTPAAMFLTGLCMSKKLQLLA